VYLFIFLTAACSATDLAPRAAKATYTDLYILWVGQRADDCEVPDKRFSAHATKPKWAHLSLTVVSCFMSFWTDINPAVPLCLVLLKRKEREIQVRSKHDASLISHLWAKRQKRIDLFLEGRLYPRSLLHCVIRGFGSPQNKGTFPRNFYRTLWLCHFRLYRHIMLSTRCH